MLSGINEKVNYIDVGRSQMYLRIYIISQYCILLNSIFDIP